MYRGRHKWFALAIGVGFGAVLAVQFWPSAEKWIEARKSASATASTKEIPAVTPVVPVQSDPSLAAVGTDSSVSDKALPFVLVGTSPGRRPQEGRAVLGTDARNAQTYLAGAVLENGSRLAEIYQDRVILEKQGKRATLYLLGHDGSKNAPADDVKALLMTAPAAAVARFVPSETVPVTDFIRFIPEYRNEVIVGIRVYPGSHSGAFSKWGLRPGDVLTSIDGAISTDPDEINTEFARLTEGATLSARVARSDGDVTISLNGADVRAAVPVRTANVAEPPP
jgi:type II secretion system protein C